MIVLLFIQLQWCLTPQSGTLHLTMNYPSQPCNIERTIVTRPEKTSLIYAKYTYSYYSTYLSPILYKLQLPNLQVLLNSLWNAAYMMKLLLQYSMNTKVLATFEVSNLDQILRVDKTDFLMPSHIYFLSSMHIATKVTQQLSQSVMIY